MTIQHHNLTGRRVLLVEDEFVIVDQIAHALEADGAEIVGPASTLDEALGLIAEGGRLDAAVLDINLRGQPVFPAADALLARGVPVIFATGYDEAVIPIQYARLPRCQKPLDLRRLAGAVSRLSTPLLP